MNDLIYFLVITIYAILYGISGVIYIIICEPSHTVFAFVIITYIFSPIIHARMMLQTHKNFDLNTLYYNLTYRIIICSMYVSTLTLFITSIYSYYNQYDMNSDDVSYIFIMISWLSIITIIFVYKYFSHYEIQRQIINENTYYMDL